MKVIVIGNNHAGTAAINHLMKEYKDLEVVSYDRNSNISFLACGIALWVGKTIEKPDGLFYSSPDRIRALGARVNMDHDVTKIDIKGKKVFVKNLKTGEEFTDSYDKLILASGSWPLMPDIEGNGLEGIKLSKLFQHAEDIINTIALDKVKNIVVVGAGYIGIELVEAFYKHGKKVTLIESQGRILNNYFDEEFTAEPEKLMVSKGIQLRTGERVVKFKGEEEYVTGVVTDKGEYDADMVIMSVGFRPNTGIVEEQLEMMSNGAIKVDRYMQTSDPDVLACGDCAAVWSNASKDYEYIALATNAVRMGILSALNLKERKVPSPGVQGSNAINVFNYKMASTGLSETAALAKRLKVKTNLVKDASRPEFMPDYDEVQIKLVYEEDSHRIVGAQIMSEGDYTLAIHTLSLAIEKEMKVEEFALTDFFFLPHFNKPVSYLTSVALSAK